MIFKQMNSCLILKSCRLSGIIIMGLNIRKVPDNPQIAIYKSHNDAVLAVPFILTWRRNEVFLRRSVRETFLLSSPSILMVPV